MHILRIIILVKQLMGRLISRINAPSDLASHSLMVESMFEVLEVSVVGMAMGTNIYFEVKR
jgi:hypothetical protein